MTITGALIMGFFASIWWTVGLRSAGHGPALAYIAPIAITAVLGVMAWRLARRERAASSSDIDVAEQARRDRLVAWASAVEGLAIFLVAAVVLPSTGHRDATASAISLIVGAHFVPLARGLPAPAYYATAAALIGLGLVGFGVPNPGTRTAVVSAGAASVLWLTAFAVLQHAGELRASGPRLPAA